MPSDTPWQLVPSALNSVPLLFFPLAMALHSSTTLNQGHQTKSSTNLTSQNPGGSFPTNYPK